MPPDSDNTGQQYRISNSAAKYAYGVAHVDSDGNLDYYRDRTFRADAELDAKSCQMNGDGCHLVRRPVDAWERVPDGE